MATLVLRLAIIMAQSSSLGAAGYVTYNNFRPVETVVWFFTELLPMKLIQLFELFIKLITDALKDILRQIQKIWEDVEDAVIYAFETVRDFILGIGERIWEEAKKIITLIADEFMKVWEKIENGFNDVIDTVEDGVTKIPGQITRGGKEVVDKIGGAVSGAVGAVGEGGKEVVDKVAGLSQAAIDAVAEGGKEAIDKVAGAGKIAIDAVGTAGEKLVGDAVDAVAAPVDAFANSGKKVIDDIGSFGGSTIKEIEQGILNLSTHASKAILDAPKRGKEEAEKYFQKMLGL
jgi:phage-related protein